MTSAIPKTLHRIWLGAPMPPEYAAFEARWQALNPRWEIVNWGEEELAAFGLANQDLYDAAPDVCPERLVPRFRSNLARYEILHRHGGVYIDADLAPLRPLADWLPPTATAFAGWEQEPTWIGNSILGSAAGHPFFAALIDGAAESVERFAGERSPKTTGPQYLTRQWEAGVPGAEALVLAPQSVFYPRHWREVHDPPPLPPEAVTDHLWTALRGQVAVVIPYRGDGAERDANLAWVLARLEAAHPSWQVVVERDDSDGPFNRAALIRSGVARSCGDVIVVHDGDVWVDGLAEAVEHVRQGAPWALPHTRVRRLAAAATAEVLAGADFDTAMALDEEPYEGCQTGGAVVLTRDCVRAVPPDPRFAGWGDEDAAWGQALRRLVGPAWRSPEPLWHLWHPPAERISRRLGNEANRGLYHRYEAATDRAEMVEIITEIGGDPSLATGQRTWRSLRTGRTRTTEVGSRQDRLLAGRPHWVLA
jgi:hypothetical protein